MEEDEAYYYSEDVMAYNRGSCVWGNAQMPLHPRPANSIPIDMYQMGIDQSIEVGAAHLNLVDQADVTESNTTFPL